jgi:hypothetical protein
MKFSLFGYDVTIHAERAIPRLPSLGQWQHIETGGIYDVVWRDAKLVSTIFLMDMERVALLYKDNQMVVDHPSRTHYHRHPSFYAYARSQARIPLYSGARMVVYRGQDGNYWVREINEFAKKFTLHSVSTID